MNRDTQKFALKCSAARVDGEWRDVYKDPVTDKGKTSKRGRLTLLRSEGGDVYRTVAVPREAASVDDAPLPAGFRPALEAVYENGRLLRDWTFDEIRERSAQALRCAYRVELRGLQRSALQVDAHGGCGGEPAIPRPRQGSSSRPDVYPLKDIERVNWLPTRRRIRARSSRCPSTSSTTPPSSR